MRKLGIDFETRSAAELKTVGLHNYARHPTTDVWCMSYSFDAAEPGLWVMGQPIPTEVNDHVRSGGAVTGWNVPFELEMWNEILCPRHGWPTLRVEQTYCSMAMAYAMALPGNLDNAAVALGLDHRKDHEGHLLMLRMARPRVKDPLTWWTDPKMLERLYAYCKQDVRVESAARDRMMPLSDRERALWLVDYEINKRGVLVDVETATAATNMALHLVDDYGTRMAAVTDGAVTSIGGVAALKEWLRAQGFDPVNGLAKQPIVEYLALPNMPPKVVEALKLRQEGAKTSTAKFKRFVLMAGRDNRLRNVYQYAGAASLRWAGRGVQLHNLVSRGMPAAPVIEDVFSMVRSGQYDLIDLVHGSPLTMMSRCMRSLLMAPPGKALVGGDFSAIEARGGAWFAGERWKIEAFLAADAGQGHGIYETTYGRMFDVDPATVENPSMERQIGKVCDLAFMYGGGVGSGRTMGKNYGVKLPDETWDELKVKWRQQHPRIVATLRSVERAAIAAVENPGQAYRCGTDEHPALFKMVGSFLWLKLPSGTAQCFPYPKLIEGKYGPQLTYMCVPDPNKPQKIVHEIVEEDEDAEIDPDAPISAGKWARVATYGGALFNRIVQGFCRDALADLLLTLKEHGAATVIHTHDDCFVEVDEHKAEGARAAMERFMCTPKPWARGLPLMAKCVILKRYGK